MARAEITKGTGNVFADLGLPQPADRQTKVRLAMALNALIAERGLRQREAAALLDIPQPKVSALLHYKLDGFSVERLMEFLTCMDCDVDILVRPAEDEGRLRVLVAS
jgi:predicted XRE-type DNA-binding protein